VGQIRQYFARTSKYFSQSCKTAILQKLYKLENTCPSQPGARPHGTGQLVEYFTGRDSTSHSASQSLCYARLTILKEYWHYATAQMALALVWERDFEQARA